MTAVCNINISDMSESEVNKYRLTSTSEPSDEMLAYIMHEVAEEARLSNEAALRKYFDEIKEMYDKKYGCKQN